jgi:excisionase family DNA binding protein
MTIADKQAKVVDLAALPPTIDLVTAARLLGIGRTTAYELVRDGRWPTPIIHAGRKIRIPSASLRSVLGVGGG